MLLHTFAQQILPVLGTPLVADGGFPWLSAITFLPLLGVLALMLMPREQDGAARAVALACTLVVFALSLMPLVLFEPKLPMTEGVPFTFQLVEGLLDWMPSVGIHYALGVDGFSIFLVLLTTFLMPLVVLSTWSMRTPYTREYMIALLFLEMGMLGALVAMDVFLFYVFWEMMLIPMYLIIGVWGGEDRVRAAVKFFLYTVVGSLLMLLAILYVYFKAGTAVGTYSFLFSDLYLVQLDYTEQVWLFLAFFLAFAIKVPLFPFHTWLPLAHVQAPTQGSVILAGVMLKMGTYGLLRYCFPLFPDALKLFAPYIAVLAVIGVLYGAIVAMVQPDVKKLVAYSSVSHLGFCVLGLVAMTPMGIAGGMYIMLAHGIATGGLFFCVGMLYERRHSKKIKDFGGIAKSMPVFSAVFLIIVFASVGVPGLNGFVGEFLALLGTSRSHFLFFDGPISVHRITAEGGGWGWSVGETPHFPEAAQQAGPELTALFLAIFAAAGVIFAAGYLLWMFRRVMFGPLTSDENAALPDMNARELGYMIPLVLMAILMGVFPQFFLSRMDTSVTQFLLYMDQRVESRWGEGLVITESTDPDYIPDRSLLAPQGEEP